MSKSRFVRRVLAVGLATLIAVGVAPTPAGAADAGLVGSFDAVSLAADGTLRVSGWALHTEGRPVDIHVYTTGPTRTVGTNLGAAFVPRPDVEALFGRARAGFDARVVTSEEGPHRLCVHAVAARVGGTQSLLLGCRDIESGRAPVGAIDAIPSRSVQGSSVSVRGWAYDPDQPRTPLAIHAYVTASVGTPAGRIPPLASVDRPDVAAAFPGAGATQGYEALVDLSTWYGFDRQSEWTFLEGRHTVCLFAIGIGAGGNTLLGCRDVHVDPRVNASLDSVTTPALGTVAASGWSYIAGEPTMSTLNTLSIRSLPMSASGFNLSSGEFVADQPRPDVDRVFPGVGTHHGYSTTASVPPGRHSVCVSTRSTTGPYVYSDRFARGRCREVVMPNALGAIDAVTFGEAGPGTMTVRGWGIDPIHPTQTLAVTAGLSSTIDVRVAEIDLEPRVTAVDRPDVNAAFGVTGRHGFEIVLRVSALVTGDVLTCVQAASFAPHKPCVTAFAANPVRVG